MERNFFGYIKKWFGGENNPKKKAPETIEQPAKRPTNVEKRRREKLAREEKKTNKRGGNETIYIPRQPLPSGSERLKQKRWEKKRKKTGGEVEPEPVFEPLLEIPVEPAPELIVEMQQEELDKEATTVADEVISEAVQSERLMPGEKLELAEEKSEEQLKQRIKTTNAFGSRALQVARDFAIGAGGAAVYKMAVGKAVRIGVKHYINLSAPGMAAVAGGVAGGSFEALMAIQKERKRIAGERKAQRSELEVKFGLERMKKILDERNQEDLKNLEAEDPGAKELFEKMQAGKINWGRVGKAALKGAAVGAIGGAAFSYLMEHTHAFDKIKHLFEQQHHEAAPGAAPAVEQTKNVLPTEPVN